MVAAHALTCIHTLQSKMCLCVCCFQRGETALHMAARAGQVEVVRCLLRNGAIVDARARVRLPFSDGSSSSTQFNLLYILFSLFNYGLFLWLCLVCRRTRLPSTSPRVWEKPRSCSFCCSTWLIPMLPLPTATPPSTSLPGRGRWRRRLFFWRLELHTHSPLRWIVCGFVFQFVATRSELSETESINSDISGGRGGYEYGYADGKVRMSQA